MLSESLNGTTLLHNNKRNSNKEQMWSRISLVAQLIKNLPAMWETWVQSLGWEEPLEEDTATHFSILAWRIPMDRGALWATIPGIIELDMSERLTFYVYYGRNCPTSHWFPRCTRIIIVSFFLLKQLLSLHRGFFLLFHLN